VDGEPFGLVLTGDPGWYRDAACREHPELSWFVTRGGDWRAPRRVCEQCLCLYECRNWSLEQDHRLQGIWGGWGEQDRARWRAERDRPPEPPDPRGRPKIRWHDPGAWRLA
jgi:hypothetical protein